MAKYTAVAATKNKCVENWDGTSEFTDEALSQLAETAPGKLVLLDFNPEQRVGVVLSAKNDNGRLILSVDLDDSVAIHKSDRIVPGYIVGKDEWDESRDQLHRIIKAAESISYGITRAPVEKDLSEIKPEKQCPCYFCKGDENVT